MFISVYLTQCVAVMQLLGCRAVETEASGNILRTQENLKKCVNFITGVCSFTKYQALWARSAQAD